MPEIAESGRLWFCVYGHEHARVEDARYCDNWWDETWKGSVCGLHDAGLRVPCSCSRTAQIDGRNDVGK